MSVEITLPEVHTPSEWSKLLGVTILDPDGWDRQNFWEDWGRPITREEFQTKASMSTIRIEPGRRPFH